MVYSSTRAVMICTQASNGLVAFNTLPLKIQYLSMLRRGHMSRRFVAVFHREFVPIDRLLTISQRFSQSSFYIVSDVSLDTVLRKFLSLKHYAFSSFLRIIFEGNKSLYCDFPKRVDKITLT